MSRPSSSVLLSCAIASSASSCVPYSTRPHPFDRPLGSSRTVSARNWQNSTLDFGLIKLHRKVEERTISVNDVARLLHVVLQFLPLDVPRQVADVDAEAALGTRRRDWLCLAVFTDKDLPSAELCVVERRNGLLRALLGRVCYDSATLSRRSSGSATTVTQPKRNHDDIVPWNARPTRAQWRTRPAQQPACGPSNPAT